MSIGEGIAITAIALSIAAYNIAYMYFESKRPSPPKDVS